MLAIMRCNLLRRHTQFVRVVCFTCNPKHFCGTRQHQMPVRNCDVTTLLLHIECGFALLFSLFCFPSPCQSRLFFVVVRLCVPVRTKLRKLSICYALFITKSQRFHTHSHTHAHTGFLPALPVRVCLHQSQVSTV